MIRIGILLDLNFTHLSSDAYASPSQKARILSEQWAKTNLYCPNCGHNTLQQHINNSPVADFACPQCREDYELKAKQGPFGPRIADGAYHTMIRRLHEANNPNLILLSYTRGFQHVSNITALPRHFFVPDMIQQRPPLAETARRAGWIGCNILLHNVPQAGLISIVSNGVIADPAAVQRRWKATRFLSEPTNLGAKGWLLTTITCIERIGQREFTLADIYAQQSLVSKQYPNNRNVQAKLRQQLQKLRDVGYLEFCGAGHYRVIPSAFSG